MTHQETLEYLGRRENKELREDLRKRKDHINELLRILQKHDIKWWKELWEDES